MSRATAEFYADLYKRHGTSHRSLSFTSALTQQLRFAALLGVLPEDRGTPFSLLDVGCGFGDLYGFLGEAGYSKVDYTGLDIMPEFVSHAAARYPDCRFLTGDFLSVDMPPAGYDCVLSSGALNMVSEHYPDHYEFVYAMIERMFALAHRGVAFNLLSLAGKAGFWEDPRFFYCDPERILAHCRSRLPDVELDHDYLSYDFAIRAWK